MDTLLAFRKIIGPQKSVPELASSEDDRVCLEGLQNWEESQLLTLESNSDLSIIDSENLNKSKSSSIEDICPSPRKKENLKSSTPYKENDSSTTFPKEINSTPSMENDNSTPQRKDNSNLSQSLLEAPRKVRTPRVFAGNDTARKKLNFDEESHIHIEAPKYPKSYKLDNIYEFLYGTIPEDLHRAENDALTLLRCILKVYPAFFVYADNNFKPFDDFSPW